MTQRRTQPDNPEAHTTPCRVMVAHATAASIQQVQAWNWLWSRVLVGHVEPGKEKEQPQELSPGAATVATVDSGHNLMSEHANDSTHSSPST